MSDHVAPASDPEPADVPPPDLTHEIGLTAERMRELFAAEDAYTRPPAAGPGEAA